MGMAYQDGNPTAAITLADAKAECRVLHDAEDDVINGYILAATEEMEDLLQRQIIKRNDESALCLSIDEVPPRLKWAIKLMVRAKYERRDMTDAERRAVWQVSENLALQDREADA